MHYKDFEGLRISKITLGTAQLGMKYGISNSIGQLKKKQVEDILITARNNGINCYDSAVTYGQSEENLGNFLKKNQDIESTIITKIPKIENNSLDGTYTQIKNIIQNSKKNLNVTQIPICLLHDYNDISHDDFMVQSIIKLKKEGLVKRIGISVYSPNEIKKFLDIEEFNVIQVPVNVLDTRLIHNGMLSELNESRIMIFARSLFLQGLLGMEIKKIPDFLKNSIEYVKKFESLANEFKIEKRKLAMLFVRDMKEITSMVIGVETSEQLIENIKFLEDDKLPEKLREQILDKFANIPEDVINPSKWKNDEK